MTDSHHLDDEALSAAIDGELAPVATAHLAGCDACASRLDALRAAAAAVASPVTPPSGARRDAALAAALQAFDEVASPDREEISAAERTPVSAIGDGRGARRGRDGLRTVSAWLGGVAAAVLLVVGLATLGDGVGGDEDADETTAGTLEEDAGAGAGGDAATGRNEGDGPSDLADEAGRYDAGDLGSFPDAEQLRAATAAAIAPLRSTESLDQQASRSSGGGAGGSAGAGTDPGATDEEESAGEHFSGDDAAESAAGAPSAGGTQGDGCEAAARAHDGRLGPLRFGATAVLEGERVVLRGFEIAGEGSPTVRVYVLAVEGCRVVTVEDF